MDGHDVSGLVILTGMTSLFAYTGNHQILFAGFGTLCVIAGLIGSIIIFFVINK